MKNGSALAFALFLVAAPLGAQQAAFHVSDYNLALQLRDTGSVISGTASLTVVRRARSDTLVLDLLDLKVDRVMHFTKDPIPTELSFVQDSAHVRVFVGRLRTDTFNVVVYYGGAVRDGLIVGKDSAGRWMAFGDNWPNRARHWIPSIDHPSEKATVSFSVLAPANRTVVANGVPYSEASDSMLKAGPSPGVTYKMTRWREKHPIPVYLFTIAAAPLARFDLPDAACGFARDGGCVKQMVYTAPEQRAAMPANFKYSPDILDFFSHLVAPFPYEKLAHLQSSTRFGGMENASAIFYADGGFRRNGTGAGTIAHETAHQWFGDAVTEREWSNLWLSEGFATYFEQLWTRHAFGDSAFRAELSRTRTQIVRDPVVASRPVIDSEQTDLMKLLDANSYQKGGWTLHMLRTLVGDSAFFRGIRAYYNAHVDGNALTNDLMHSIEQTSGMKLGWFFDQWLRRPGFASITTSWRYDAAAKRVILDVEQGDKYAPYRLTLATSIVDAAGIAHMVRTEVAAERLSHITLPLPLDAAPKSLSFDPDVELLAEFHFKAAVPRN
ncbi:MAG TPA: M1 family metallopeptidase [Gemmatimonadaceae bacterium]|jgi:aminopeptidase N|nr:M1 family metallopeptidase [Gemmatimonadaceae bacterium]